MLNACGVHGATELGRERSVKVQHIKSVIKTIDLHRTTIDHIESITLQYIYIHIYHQSPPFKSSPSAPLHDTRLSSSQRVRNQSRALALTTVGGHLSITRAAFVVPVRPRRHAAAPRTARPARPLAQVRPRRQLAPLPAQPPAIYSPISTGQAQFTSLVNITMNSVTNGCVGEETPPCPSAQCLWFRRETETQQQGSKKKGKKKKHPPRSHEQTRVQQRSRTRPIYRRQRGESSRWSFGL